MVVEYSKQGNPKIMLASQMTKIVTWALALDMRG
jgi:hypothetical protein